MTITNKKLLKSYKSILSSSLCAKELVTLEMEKVDEKYRKLAEAEKADLSNMLEMLDSQISLYSSFLADDAPTQEEPNTAAAPEEPEAEPEKVVDTIYEENNAEDDAPVVEETVSETVENDPFSEVANSPWDAETVDSNVVEEADNNEAEPEIKAEDSDVNDGWPMPENW